jgi:hypothetical protein
VEHYLKASLDGALSLKRLWLYALSDENEKNDSLPSPTVHAYGKSLLYLVSRALDDVRKMPLLGMERALDPRFSNDADQWNSNELSAIRVWQASWAPMLPETGEHLVSIVTRPKVQNNKAGSQISATHGSFDNNIDVMSETLVRIKGAALLSEMEWLDY